MLEGTTRLQRSLLLIWAGVLLWSFLEAPMLRWALDPRRAGDGWLGERALDLAMRRGDFGESLLGRVLRSGRDEQRVAVLERLRESPRYGLLQSMIWALVAEDDACRRMAEDLVEAMVGQRLTAEDFSRSRGEEIEALVSRLDGDGGLESTIARIGLPALPYLVARLRDRRVSEAGRIGAMRCLAAMDYGVSAEIFLPLFASERQALREEAIRVFERRGESWRGPLRQQLLSSNPRVSRGAARALARMRDRGGARLVLDFYRERGWSWGGKRERLRTLSLLAVLRDPDAVEPLKRWLDVEEDTVIQVELVATLVASGGDAVVGLLADTCCVASPVLQRCIVGQLERLGTPRARQALAGLIHQGSFDGSVMEWALSAQARMAAKEEG